MTGEISLRGSVLPVGGIKSKVLAAHREGIRRVVLPKRNKKDARDIPDDVLRDLQIIFVDSIEEMLDAVLEGGLHGDTQGSMEILPEEGGHAGEDGPMPGVTATGSDADEPLLSNL